MPKNKDGVETVLVGLRLPKPAVRRLDALCKTNRRSRTELVDMLLHDEAQRMARNPARRLKT